ncbi:MAG: type II 3-dehydroquinate dehydratase [Alphaproteobacteria bacterium]
MGGGWVAKAPRILILNGPNLNMLGIRQPKIYGAATLADIEAACLARAKDLGLTAECRQSNSEGELIGWIHAARDESQAVIINPGAYSHTSVAIMDALLAVDLPIVEVHLSNIHQREEFRHHSYVSKAAQGVICGFGPRGYIMALDALAAQLIESQEA